MLNLCAKTHYHIRAPRRIRPMLTEDIAKSVACSLVNARLDYANLILFGVTSKNILKLQMVQNTLARVLQRRDHITPTLKRLHWLPIKSHIDFNPLTARQNFSTLSFGAGQIFSFLIPGARISCRFLAVPPDNGPFFHVAFYPDHRLIVHCSNWFLSGPPADDSQRVKIASLTFKVCSTNQPAYLASLISSYHPGRALRSLDHNRLTVPRVRTAAGIRDFSAAVLLIWNNLPYGITTSPSFDSFWRNLKTYFFTIALE